jgi:hypothetical protein
MYVSGQIMNPPGADPKITPIMVFEVGTVIRGPGGDTYECGTCGATMLIDSYPGQFPRSILQCGCGADNLSP